MSLSVSQAERLLLKRYNTPAKAPTNYVIGFRTPAGKVLAMHRTTSETLIWFQPPAPPQIDDVELMVEPNNGNSNINGPFEPLRHPSTMRARVDSAAAFIGSSNGMMQHQLPSRPMGCLARLIFHLHLRSSKCW